MKAKVALLTSDCVDEWLDCLDLRMEDLSHTQCGGWFNTLHALIAAGYDVTLIGTSTKVDEITRFHNRPTLATIVILPSGWLHRRAKHFLGRCSGHRSILMQLVASLVAYTSLPLQAFMTVLRERAFDALVIEQYGIERTDTGVLASALLGIPVYAMYSAVVPESRLSPVRALRKFTMRRIDGFGVCSANEADRLATSCGIARHRLHATIFPVDTQFWVAQNKSSCRALLDIPPQARVCIWHGGFDVAVKGLDTLIAAWSHVIQRQPDRNFRLLIIGNRHGAEPLRKAIGDTQATGVCLIDRWIHDRHEIRNYLSAADFYVFPSRSEAFGISPIEAMSCGLPAILSSTAGVSELFCGEAEGVVKVVAGDVESWAAAIERLLTDPPLCERLGFNATLAVASKASIKVGARALASMLNQSRPSP